ncbi:MAG: HEAT repeat domain-containing protein, partial [Acidobacteria bacterium]|nr:HEAT repeat domain-containing protein [Acidobacteriota bacterium]
MEKRRVNAVIVGMAVAGVAAAQSTRFDDVVRNLKNPDAKVRIAAVRLLNEANHAEAAEPVAALVIDPVDEVQLAAIDAVLTFFLAQDIPARRRVGGVIEVRNRSRAKAAFDAGPTAVRAQAVPPALVPNLLAALRDEHARVRLDAAYTIGVAARPPLGAENAKRLVAELDHYDPAIRATVARVLGRLQVLAASDALVNALNDSNEDVRVAAMRALGDLRSNTAVQALTDQVTFYGKGPGAGAALDALARIAHATSVPLFKSRAADKDPAIRRAAVEGLARALDASAIADLEVAIGMESSEPVRLAMAFALQKLGREYLDRL